MVHKFKMKEMRLFGSPDRLCQELFLGTSLSVKMGIFSLLTIFFI